MTDACHAPPAPRSPLPPILFALAAIAVSVGGTVLCLRNLGALSGSVLVGLWIAVLVPAIGCLGAASRLRGGADGSVLAPAAVVAGVAIAAIVGRSFLEPGYGPLSRGVSQAFDGLIPLALLTLAALPPGMVVFGALKRDRAAAMVGAVLMLFEAGLPPMLVLVAGMAGIPR